MYISSQPVVSVSDTQILRGTLQKTDVLANLDQSHADDDADADADTATDRHSRHVPPGSLQAMASTMGLAGMLWFFNRRSNLAAGRVDSSD